MSRPKILVLILAGGKGSRLETLTRERAKPALPFGGVYKLIDFALSNCVHSELSNVWVIEQYQLHSLNDHLSNGRPWDLDRTHGGLLVLPPYTNADEGDESEGGFAEGNADAIYRHRRMLREFAPDILIVLSADHIYRLDLRDVIDQHLSHRADVTMVTTSVDPQEASRFGIVQTNSKGRITAFDYKPEEPRGNLATTEVFVYNATVLLDTLDELAREGELEDFGHQLVPQLVKRGKAFAFHFEGYWRDVGTVESYWQAHMDLLGEHPELGLDDPQWPILSYGTQRIPARIHAGARIESSLVSPGCNLAGRVINSVLSPGVVVEAGATVRDSVLLRNVRVQKGAQIHRAIIDSYAQIGENARIGTATKAVPSADNITLVGRTVQVPADAKIKAGERVEVRQPNEPGT